MEDPGTDDTDGTKPGERHLMQNVSVAGEAFNYDGTESDAESEGGSIFIDTTFKRRLDSAGAETSSAGAWLTALHLHIADDLSDDLPEAEILSFLSRVTQAA